MADANAAKTSEARAFALDQLARANEESAKLRELNDQVRARARRLAESDAESPPLK